MSDYETNYLIGMLSWIGIWGLLAFLYWISMPVWFSFVGGITAAVLNPGMLAIFPYLSSESNVLNWLTEGIVVAFFALLTTVLIALILLPFRKAPQQQVEWGGA